MIKDRSIDFSQIRFIKGAHTLNQCLPDEGKEVALLGRSNVGKSSALNALAGVNCLARTSKLPGRTRQINFFEFQPKRYIVDLPGYGFAKVPLPLRQHWEKNLRQYLRARRSLVGLIVMVDARHSLKVVDEQLISDLAALDIDTHCVLTKTDKLSQAQAAACLQQTGHRVQGIFPKITVQIFSALRHRGVDELRQRILRWLVDED